MLAPFVFRTSLSSISTSALAAGLIAAPVMLPGALIRNADRAWAACTAGPNAYACSGNMGSLNITDTPLTSLSLDSTFVVTGTGWDAVAATNNGPGAMTITSAGSATSLVYNSNPYTAGVNARNNAGSTDLTINQTAGTIAGLMYGINAFQSGTGAMTITTAGTVNGSMDNFQSFGVYAVYGNSAGTGNATINQTGGTISAMMSGIRIENYGLGATTVTTAGTITSTGATNSGYFSYAAVYASAWNAQSTSTVTVNQTAGSISGGDAGILAQHYGLGSVDVTTAGTVAGTFAPQSAGVVASIVNNASTGNVTVTQTAGSISGSTFGIRATNVGKGSTTVTTAGTVTGTAGIGVLATNSGKDLKVEQTAGKISGVSSGISATNTGTGSTAVITVGTVSASAANGTGVLATNYGQNLTVEQTAGSITGGGTGIKATNGGQGFTAVTTAGTVTGSSENGVYASNTGTDLTVKQTAGEISGGTNGINAENGGMGTASVTTAGTVTGSSGAGVLAYSYGTDLKIEQTAGKISGSSDGVNATNVGTGATTITTAGAVTGTSGSGVSATNYGTDLKVEQTAGEIKGAADGIGATNYGTGTTTLNVAALVTGGSGAGVQTNTITGSTVAINLQAGSDVSASSGLGVQDTDGNATATLQSGSKVLGAIRLGNGSDTVNIAGGADISALTALDGGDNVSSSDGMIDTLNLDRAITGSSISTGMPDNIQIANWEKVNVRSGGALNLTGDLATEMLDVKGGGTVTSAAGIQAVTVSGSIANAGTIDLNANNTNTGNTFTVTGDYVGNGGTLELNTYLASDNAPTDKLIVDGDVSGTTTLNIRNSGGPGAATTANGIEVIHVGGTSQAGAFSLGAAVAAGAYDYNLYLGGVGDDAGNQNWYLRSTGKLSPNSQTALPYADVLSNFAQATLGTLQQRTGNRIWPDGTAAVAANLPPAGAMAYAKGGPALIGQGAWGRMGGQYSSFAPRTGSAYNQSIGFLQAGYEGVARETAAGDLTIGAYAIIGTSTARIDVSNDPATGAARAKGRITTQGYGIGANLTWLGHDGLYADAIGQFTWYDSSLSNKNGRNQGWSTAASLEVGKRYELGSGWAVVPQAQLAWTHVDFSSFTDNLGNRIALGRGDSLQGRAGIRLEHLSSWQDANGQTARLQFYGIANLTYEFLKGRSVKVSGASLVQSNRRLWGEVGAGATYAWNKNWSAYGEASYAMALSGKGGDNYTLKGTAGLRYRW
ncbi:hypothetical protein BA190_04925 [Labrys sp. WJW]|uniref:autotransporter outer membrane beta-barrel domain-containing protein n=1 Tax=Labrys sp. WJW TaxID=1737983 RepID=UPI000835FFAA|nr:autotransporter outer membrane beta-barrel domain-containing protein [Labrys sp. WJW]OCC06066.1 hypothetical protein BA190_04925 [Labrys sp. WJW]